MQQKYAILQCDPGFFKLVILPPALCMPGNCRRNSTWSCRDDRKKPPYCCLNYRLFELNTIFTVYCLVGWSEPQKSNEFTIVQDFLNWNCFNLYLYHYVTLLWQRYQQNFDTLTLIQVISNLASSSSKIWNKRTGLFHRKL